MTDKITKKQLSWFDFRKDYGPKDGVGWIFDAGYDAALRDLGHLPAESGYPDA